MTADEELAMVRKQAADLFLANHVEKHDQERQAETSWREGHDDRHERQLVSHQAVHISDGQAVRIAVDAERFRLEQHAIAHADAHAAHERIHDLTHEGHKGQHVAEHQAVAAAQQAMDKRLDAMNEFRDQLRDQASSFVRREIVDQVEAHIERRYEELRATIAQEREERRERQNLQVGAQRGISQSTAIIVGAIGLVGTLLAIVVVVINLITGTPA